MEPSAVSNFYIPKGTSPNVAQPQIRLGLQAPGGGGKTTSALTFPNAIVLDLDNSLTAFPEQPCLPFWNMEWLKENYPDALPKKANGAPQVSDFLLKWFRQEGMKMRHGQTIILDSWSALQDNFDLTHDNLITQSGEENAFSFWAQKFDYSQELMTLICSCKCDVVVTFHDNPTRDKKTGVILDKIAPLMQGKFAIELKRYFTDFYRVVTEDKKNAKGEVEGSNYFWQVRSDSRFDAKCRIKNLKEGIFKVPAHYRFFIEHGLRTS